MARIGAGAAVARPLGRGHATAFRSRVSAGARRAQDAGHPRARAPGASAVLAALAIVGLPTDAFGFVGFLPPKSEARANAIAALAERRDTLVSTSRRAGWWRRCGAMEDGFGYDRPAAVALELTKRFERTYRGTVGSVLAELEADRGDQGRGGDPRRRGAGAGGGRGDTGVPHWRQRSKANPCAPRSTRSPRLSD